MEATVVAINAKNAMVEYVIDKEVKRVIIPFALIADQIGTKVEIDEQELAKGIPFGVPFAEIINLQVTPYALERALHNAGIWEYYDMVSKPSAVIGAIKQALNLDISTLMSAAQDYEKKVKSGVIPVTEPVAPEPIIRKSRTKKAQGGINE